MPRTFVLAVIGPDGAGKTSLARMLLSRLRARSCKARLVHMRSHHMASYLLLRLLIKVGLIDSVHSPRTVSLSLRSIYGGSIIFWTFEAVNVVLWLIFNVLLPRLFGYIIVADRFVPDFWSYCWLGGGSRAERIGRVLTAAFARAPGIVYIYLRASPTVLASRKLDEELSDTFLKAQLVLYDRYAKALRLRGVEVIEIDSSNRDLVTVMEHVVEQLNKLGEPTCV